MSNSWDTIVAIVGGKNFHIHKRIITGKSSVFETMFISDHFVEGQENQVTIDDIEPSVFEVMLNYLYKNKLPDHVLKKGKQADKLLLAADKVWIS